jgi:hypothetical protein
MKGLKAAVLALALALALAAAVVVGERRAVAEWLLLARLRGAGLASAALSVEEVGPDSLRVRELRIGDGDLEVPLLELRYSAGSLWRGRLEALRAEGLRLRASLRDGELHLGSLDVLRAPGREPADAGGAARLPALPVDRLELPDASLALDTASGVVEAAPLALEARLDAPGGLPSGRLAVDRIRDLGSPPRFPPAALELRFAPEDDQLGFEATLGDAAGQLHARAVGSLDLAAGSGRATLSLDPLRLGEGGLAPGDLLPSLAALIPAARGSLEARGELTWSRAGVDGHVDLGLRDLALRTPAARFEHVDGVVRLAGPWPPFVPPGQLVSMARVDFGLELTNGLVRYGVTRDGVVEVESAEWHFAGGTVRTRGRIDPSARERPIELEVEDVDLQQLLQLVNLEGLSGEGRLAGRLPLTLRPGHVEIRDARLESSAAGGWIRYRPRGDAAALGVAGQALDDLLQALRNFHFERLSLAASGDAREALRVQVSLSGANPGHRDAQPYELNLNVEGRLGDLIRQGSAAYQIPAKIERKLDEISGRRR